MPDPHANIVAEVIARIQKARLERGISQEDLAREASVSRGCVQHMEKGRTTPTLLSLLKISAALELDLSHTLQDAILASAKRKSRGSGR